MIEIKTMLSFGGGTNSTAMLIGLRNKKIVPDLILFADPGGEMPKTYEHIEKMQIWLKNNNMPPITIVKYYPRKKEGDSQTLEQECLQAYKLPSIAYGGFKTCSQKYKIYTQEKFVKEETSAKKIWAKGERIKRYIGYDYGEPDRRNNARKFDRVNNEYENLYPMVDDWEWDRKKCEEVILNEGLELPGKSSCFFCPNMKKQEIIDLKKYNKDLFDRAIKMEENADLTTIKGLGRNWSWKDFIYNYENQINIFDLFDEDDDVCIPCGCYD